MDRSPDTPSPQDEQPSAPVVPLGLTMPDLSRVPTLQPMKQAVPVPVLEVAARHSILAQGMAFTGSVQLAGSLTVGGEVQGNVRVQDDPQGQVTVSETGSVTGDITAPNIAVSGRTTGLLDAAGGRVTLHETSSVSGRIRYTQLQVNGADLNAQLERVRQDNGAGQR